MKPQALRPGDTIGVVAPSWGGPAHAPHRVERGKHWLEARGYQVVFAPHAAGSRGYVSGTAEERAEDLHTMFADPRVRAIITAIGGDHACHLLPLLDFELIRSNPKILMGFSDVTVLNVAIHARTGLVTFNGPHVMTDLAEYPEPFPYAVDAFERVLCRATPIGPLLPALEWTDEHLDWITRQDITRPRTRQAATGWSWLKGVNATGPLIGGCLESLQHLRGTPYWPELEGAMLFIETSEEVPSPAWVDGVLQDYENMGAFARISALLVGRPMGYTDEQKEALRAILLERTRRYSFPIVADMDFGHTSPQLILPLGCRAELDVQARHLAIMEPAVGEPPAVR